ncbi:uncharacterized, partial [Tachysurus ichikawai]
LPLLGFLGFLLVQCQTSEATERRQTTSVLSAGHTSSDTVIASSQICREDNNSRPSTECESPYLFGDDPAGSKQETNY